MSSSDMACWNLSQARPSLQRRVIELPQGALDWVALGGLDESKSRICIDGCLVGVGGTTKPALTTPDLDDPCFAFLWPQRLGRLSISTILDMVFLLSPANG